MSFRAHPLRKEFPLTELQQFINDSILKRIRYLNI
jgi:NADH:ubiquinone oxidoreductase subunit C